MNSVEPPAVRLDGVHVGYGREDVLKGVDVEFRRNEIFVLLGPNGAGKSTLVRLLTGALRPSAGVVRFAKGAGKVGLAPQQIALYPWLSPRENAIAFGRLGGLSRAACSARLPEVMRLTGCEPVAQTMISRLSGGYQRRANVAAALMNNPDLLILDEPTAGLDAEGRADVAQVLDALRADGAAILLVTHDFDFAESLADRVGVLVAGALVACGPPAQLIAARLGAGERTEVMLKEPPDAEGGVRLAALGAEPTEDARVFRLVRPFEDIDTRSFAAEVAAAGLRLGEWRVRPPGLADLFESATLFRERDD